MCIYIYIYTHVYMYICICISLSLSLYIYTYQFHDFSSSVTQLSDFTNTRQHLPTSAHPKTAGHKLIIHIVVNIYDSNIDNNSSSISVIKG